MDDWHGGEGTAAGSLLYPVSCFGSDRTDCGGGLFVTVGTRLAEENF